MMELKSLCEEEVLIVVYAAALVHWQRNRVCGSQWSNVETLRKII